MCFVTVLQSDGCRVWRQDYLILSSACRLLLGGRLISHACLSLCYLWVCVACAFLCVCVCAAKHGRRGNQLLTWRVVFRSFSVLSSLVCCFWNNPTCRTSSESRGVISQRDNKHYCSDSHQPERLIESRQAGKKGILGVILQKMLFSPDIWYITRQNILSVFCLVFPYSL